MATEIIYYQVMEWDANNDTFHEMLLTKSEDRALTAKHRYEVDAIVDAKYDQKPNQRYYFVSTLSEELVKAIKHKRYEQKLNEAREFFMSQYDGDFLPYCQSLIKVMRVQFETHIPEEFSVMEREGETLRTSEIPFDSWTHVWLEAKFKKDGSACLHTLIKRGDDDAREAIVNEFECWESLYEWLGNEEEASKECEQKFIESCIDSFRWMLYLPEE